MNTRTYQDVTGLTVTATVRNPSTGSQAGTFNLTETGTTGYYLGTFPAIAAGTYDVVYYAGGVYTAIETVAWDGTQIVTGTDLSGVTSTLAAIKAQTDKINTSNIVTLSAVAYGTVELVQGDYRLAADGRALLFVKPQGADWPSNLAGFTITFNAKKSASNFNSGSPDTLSITGSVVAAADPGQAVQVEIDGSQTTGLAVGVGGWEYEVVATKTNDRATLVRGPMTVHPKVA